MAAAFTGCDDDFARPPMVFPSTPDITTTASIEEIKSQYWSIVEGTPQEIGLDANGDSIIIKGRICSSDETGNIYKNIIVQTVDADGQQWALTFAVNKTKMYETYKFGQEIYINLTGMSIGGYRGLMQLGRVGDSGMSFMDEAMFTGHATPSGLPRLADVDTAATTIAALDAVKADNLGRMMWQSRLVRVEGVEFEEPGEVFAGSANTNRYIKDGEGHRMIVRNSAYATFKNERIPGGTGNVTGILSYFGSDWQILLVDEAGCSDFTGGDAPAGNTILSESFGASLGDFTIENVSLAEGLDHVWSWGGAIYGAKASAYVNGTSYASESWLISPEIDLTAVSGATLVFEHVYNKFPSPDFAKANCTLWVREGAGEWKSLAIPTVSNNDGWTFVSSGDISLDAYAGKKVQLGFKYVSEAGKAGTWEVKNLSVTAK